MGSKFDVGKFAVSIWPPNLPREIQGSSQKFASAPSAQEDYACFLGVSAKFTTRNPGASAKFPTAKLTTAHLTWHQSPPPPLYKEVCTFLCIGLKVKVEAACRLQIGATCSHRQLRHLPPAELLLALL